MAQHSIQHLTSFQDCDPAGIVFYPRFFALFDRTFHDWLREFGGHAAVCERLGAIGLGLITADAVFRSPARDGDILCIEMEILDWGRKKLALAYAITCGERLVATGTENRGIFVETDQGLRTEEMMRFRALVAA